MQNLSLLKSQTSPKTFDSSLNHGTMLQLFDATQRNFKCPSEVQVGSVSFDDIDDENK